MKSQLFLTALLPSTTSATQVANFNVSASVAARYGCNGTCYSAFSTGIAADAALSGTTFDKGFYATASNFSSSSPGDILKFQPINPAELFGIPRGTTAYRIQYTSVDSFGQPVPVTGFVAFPFASPANGHRYRTVAWAHGTSGVFRGCAPSAYPSLYEYGSWSYLIEQGYAVVATDYAGLGNDYIAHPYVALAAHANDVFYSVAAARKVFGRALTEEWMGVGHSQGGGAVWSLAESSLLAPSPNAAGKYLGTVAQAPGVFMGSTALEALSEGNSSDVSTTGGVLGELGWAVIGFQNLYPNETFGWIDGTFRQRLELAKRAQACYDSMEAIGTGLDLDDIIDLSSPATAMQALRVVNAIDELSGVGTEKSAQPVLVVQGLDDVSVLPEVVMSAYKTTCHSGSEVHIQLYPHIGHDPVIPAAAPSFLKWMDDRFDGVATSGKCSKTTVKPFDAAYLYAPVDED